jgi:chemotaxis protein CheD
MGNGTYVVKMAEISVIKNNGGSQPLDLKTTLGSCVGIILTDKKSSVHGLAHIMLPEMQKRDVSVGKYADTAIPALLEKMKEKGAIQSDIRAFLLGGACMFSFTGTTGMAVIGDKNVEAAQRILGELDIPVVFQETGGNCGRTVHFNSGTGKVSIKTLEKINGLKKGA